MPKAQQQRLASPLFLDLGMNLPTVLTDRLPPWMVRVKKLKWTVRNPGAKRHSEIDFEQVFFNGKHLSDYPLLLDGVMRILYGIRTGSMQELDSGDGQRAIAQHLFMVIRFMLSRGIERFSDIRRSHVQDYADRAVYGVHALFGSDQRLKLHIEACLAETGIKVDDSREERQQKAEGVFPLVAIGVGKFKQLHRRKILLDARLDSLQINGDIKEQLDELDRHIGAPPPREVRGGGKRNDLPVEDDSDDRVTSEHLRRMLKAFELLYRHRLYLADGMVENPFPNSSAGREARIRGVASGRTKTIPAKIGAHFIERSARWVLDYSAPLLAEVEWLDRVAERSDNPMAAYAVHLQLKKWSVSGPACPNLVASRYRGEDLEPESGVASAEQLRDGMALATAVNFLITACGIVIAALSARRASEILGLRAGCIERDEAGRPWLRSFIHKTLQDDASVPVPEIVVLAVSILERISAKARAATGSSYLFIHHVPGTRRVLGLDADKLPTFNLGSFMSQFGYFVDVPVDENGNRWHFCPHQFRRFFAILYIWSYDFGDMGALSQHLRHNDLLMTRRYVTGPEIGCFIAQAGQQRAGIIIEAAQSGQTQLAGQFGERLNEVAQHLHEQMSQQVRVVAERDAAQYIGRLREGRPVELVALPWGYCAVTPPEPNEARVCNRGNAEVPDLAGATPSTCRNCQFAVRSSEFAPFVKSSAARHARIAADSSYPKIMRDASAALALGFDEYLSSVGALKGEIANG